MKKSFSIILAAALVLTLTACNNSGESSDSAVGASVPEASSAADNESASAPAALESIDTAVSDDPIVVPDDPNNPADPDDPGSGGVDNSGLEFPDNRAGRMVKAALAEGEWGAVVLLDGEMMTAVSGINPDDCEEFCCVQAMISAVANEIYCVKPKSGSMDAVKSAINSYVEVKQNDPMQYPMVQAAWEQAVVEEDGGYVYLVVHPDNAQTVADTMGATK